jgi:AraC-like DNA-binding protein
VSSILAMQVVAEAARRDLDLSALLRVSGSSPAELTNLEHRLPFTTLERMWSHLFEVTSDRGVGIEAARRVRVRDLHVMGYAIMTSADGREALRRAARFGRLMCEVGEWSVEEEGKIAKVRCSAITPQSVGAALSTESAMTGFIACFRESSQVDFAIRSASFRHPLDIGRAFSKAPSTLTNRASSRATHEEFFRGKVSFGTSTDEFVIDRELLDLVPRDSNATLAEFFQSHAESLVSKLGASEVDLSGRIRFTVADKLTSGAPSMQSVARAHGLSERSLRRHLADAGTTFRELVEEVRIDRAVELLRQGKLQVTEVAFMVGFSDLSAFSRAFKRKKGAAPSEFEIAHA